MRLKPGGRVFAALSLSAATCMKCRIHHPPIVVLTPGLIPLLPHDASSVVDVSERSTGMNPRVMRILFVVVARRSDP
jgi:uncharacterized membrane protein YjjB (DUF3815 family)